MSVAESANIDRQTVAGFGLEWSAFNQAELPVEEHCRVFNEFFSEFPWDDLPPGAEGFDLGCGSGRWAALVAPRVGQAPLHRSGGKSARRLPPVRFVC